MTSARWLLVLVAANLGLAPTVSAQQILVQPYLQRPAPDSMRVKWETSTGDESVVDWGLTPTLGTTASGSAVTGLVATRVHSVLLAGLTPGTRYYYAARTGSAVSTVLSFVTPPAADVDPGFTVLALSDTQRDSANPDKLDEIVHQGVIDLVTADGTPLDEALAMTLIVGDLVTSGWTYSQWRDQFFAPTADLMARVPTLPVLGNHEANTPTYFNYFDLPDNGSAGYLEHWWFHDRGNLRVIGLDSNTGYRLNAQLDWLQAVLDDACADDQLDFVVTQLHHPYYSELWPAGELDYSGEVVAILEDFARRCGKPTLYLFGHTHGYSRGQSQDSPLLWVNVASASGNIDYWGEYSQYDVDLFTVSQDEWGFVLLDVEAGTDPQLTLRRISRGDEGMTLDNVESDRVLLHRFNSTPETPVGLSPTGPGISPHCVVLTTRAFSDADGDAHQASQWQLSTSCQNFTNPAVDLWEQDHNWYRDVDTRAGETLLDEELRDLQPDTAYCWRVRFRDSSLGWSAWSTPVPFTTGPSRFAPVALQNPGAENGMTGWSVVGGVFESLTGGECNGTQPHAGTRYFAAGLCNHAAASRAEQSLDLRGLAADIDTARSAAFFGGYLGDWEGRDLPELELVFLDENGGELGRSPRIGTPETGWNRQESRAAIPAGTRTLVLAMVGTRGAGTDNDSYFDDLFVQVSLSGLSACELPDPGSLDAGVDAGQDAGLDAGGDSGVDAAIDAGGGLDAASIPDAPVLPDTTALTDTAELPDLATEPDTASLPDSASAPDVSTEVDAAVVATDAQVADLVSADTARLDAEGSDSPTVDAAIPDAPLIEGGTAADVVPTDAPAQDILSVDGQSSDAAAVDGASPQDAGVADVSAPDQASAADRWAQDTVLDVSSVLVDASAITGHDAGTGGSHVAQGCGCASTAPASNLLGAVALLLIRRRRRLGR